MAAKDADLTRDFSLDFVYVQAGTPVAAFEVSLLTTPQQSLAGGNPTGDRTEELFLTEELGTVFEIELVATPHGTGAGGGVTYRMRGFDQNGSVNDYVFWSSSTVDSGAVNYAGSAGPVVDIVVHSRIGV